MPKIDLAKAPEASGSRYPAPFDVPCQGRRWRKLGEAAGFTHFGVNVVELSPGTWSSQRHWHSHEDEFVWVLEGEVTLVTDAGEERLVAGECAGFKGGDRNGHCFQNQSQALVRLLVVGSRSDEDHGEYPDIDMVFAPGRYREPIRYLRKDGTPY